ncbi:MAG: hypothetical protein JNM65_06160 [Verrucomicrobiaceae bacterium]|nr:hypothetical protein [Verrucomicrobiaceae bacterium]
MAEQATGEKFLPDGDISDRALIEAISKIVVADVIVRRKDGSRIAPGAVTQGVKATLQQSAAARGLSAFLRAFRVFFGQVFKTARALAKARKEGKLSADWEAQLGGSSAESVGKRERGYRARHGQEEASMKPHA